MCYLAINQRRDAYSWLPANLGTPPLGRPMMFQQWLPVWSRLNIASNTDVGVAIEPAELCTTSDSCGLALGPPLYQPPGVVVLIPRMVSALCADPHASGAALARRSECLEVLFAIQRMRPPGRSSEQMKPVITIIPMRCRRWPVATSEFKHHITWQVTLDVVLSASKGVESLKAWQTMPLWVQC